MDFIIEEKNVKEIADIIEQGVSTYNQPYFGEIKEDKKFAIYIRHSNNIIGGISGNIFNKYIRVGFAWIDENYRNKKLGTKLFKELEKFAKSKNCTFIQLATFDFQARPFYEKIGFECLGIIPKWLEGRDCAFMRKVLI